MPGPSSNDLGTLVPHLEHAVVAARQDAIVANTHAGTSPLCGIRGSRQDIHRRDPIVVLVTCHVERRDKCLDILDAERGLRADAVLREEVVQRGAQELAIDEEFEGDRACRFQQPVDEGGELVAAEFCEMSAWLKEIVLL